MNIYHFILAVLLYPVVSVLFFFVGLGLAQLEEYAIEEGLPIMLPAIAFVYFSLPGVALLLYLIPDRWSSSFYGGDRA